MMLSLLPSFVLAGLLACSTTPTVTEMPDPTSAPPPATDSTEAAPGEVVTVVGVAHNAKLSAIVVNERRSLYCIELDEWPDEVLGQTVEVTGRLEVTDQYAATVNEKGEISQGTSGGDTLLREVTWTLVE